MGLLHTDGYKFSMAEAGWPLRRETFYYAQRRGAPAVVPLDIEAHLRALLPAPAPEDYAFLASNAYEMGAGFKAAVLRTDVLQIRALPKGSWFLPREPVFSITGPSALVSWIEPLALQIHYRIQVATLAVTDPAALAAEVRTVTCDEQRDVVAETLEAVGVRAPPMQVDSGGYVARVREATRRLVDIVGDGARIFEVGFRAATCLSQHMLALEGCREAGVTRTSHVEGARRLGMVPIGTMGHEHVQRFGSDEAAFRAMRDRRPGRSSYLLDTFDTMRSGIPAAYRVMEEERSRGDSIRYDSGDKEAQYRFAIAEAKRRGLRPIQILEDSFDEALTRRFEELRAEVGYGPEEQYYGYGGHLVAKTAGTTLSRDKVAAVFKLSQSATTPTMKFGDEAGAGKESVPGRPVVFRRVRGEGALGIIGQEGERAPEGYVDLAASAERLPRPAQDDAAVGLSQETSALVRVLREARALRVAGALAGGLAGGAPS